MTSPAEAPQWITLEQAQQMAAEAASQAAENAVSQLASQHAAEQQSTGSVPADQIQAMIDSALAQQAEAHNASLQALLAGMRGTVVTYVPEHAGGPGTEIAETWSQYEQEQSKAAKEAALRAA